MLKRLELAAAHEGEENLESMTAKAINTPHRHFSQTAARNVVIQPEWKLLVGMAGGPALSLGGEGNDAGAAGCSATGEVAVLGTMAGVAGRLTVECGCSPILGRSREWGVQYCNETYISMLLKSYPNAKTVVES